MLPLLTAGLAFSNGLTTHVWITLQARQELPEGDLKDFVNDPAVEDALRNGAMFPDGGYAVGDGYGEIAHWEPFQSELLDTIRETWGPPPYTGDAAQHVAFLLGMASHGMGDQVFDGNYIERVRVYDADAPATTSFDEATDVALAAATGGEPVPPLWVPEILPEVFARYGYTVTQATLEDGQSLAGVAVAYVGLAGQNPDAVAAYAVDWPWATSHLFDPTVTGNPPQEAVAVAWYWQTLWARLQGEDDFDPPVIGTFPADGATGHPTAAASIESRVGLVFSRGLIPDSVPTGVITVVDGAGHTYAPETQVYYGTSSHLVLLKPYEDWATDEDFTVTVAPFVTTIAGQTMSEPWSFQFSTRTPPPVDTGSLADSGAPAEGGCGCATGGGDAALGMALGGLLLAGTRRRPAPVTPGRAGTRVPAPRS